jgi:hypothetical protein
MIGSACIAEDGGGVFATQDRAFGNHQRIVLRRFGVGNAKIARLLDLADADRRSFAGRLDEQRQAQLGFDAGKVTVGVEQHVFRHRQPTCLPEQFAAPFVHAQRRGHHATAGIRDAHQFENTLDGAVFAVTPVQRNESAIEGCQFVELAL